MALAESCVSQQIARETPRLMGAQIDLSWLLAGNQNTAGNGHVAKSAAIRLDALLFGETQGRIVITTSALDAVKVVERAKLLGVTAARVGTIGADNLTISTGDREFSWPVNRLYDRWWNAIAVAMKA